jgi:hypothetical protein
MREVWLILDKITSRRLFQALVLGLMKRIYIAPSRGLQEQLSLRLLEDA